MKLFTDVENYFTKNVRHNDRSLIKAIDSVGDPPLPIPNREVKPNSADGTANVCGRVGHRHFYLEALNESLGLLFLLSHLARIVLVIAKTLFSFV